MLERGSGHIVGVSSLAGRVWLPFSSSYAAAKSAFCRLLEAIRIEVIDQCDIIQYNMWCNSTHIVSSYSLICS